MSKTRTLVILTGMAMCIAMLALALHSTPQTVNAQNPTTPPVPAIVRIVPVSANANVAQEPNAITATVKYVTDTAVGPASATRGQSSSGLGNVPINVPVHVLCESPDAKNPGKPAWTLLKPADSKAVLKDPAAKVTEFTPDVIGAYMVTCNLGTGFEVNGVQLNAGMFIGVDKGNCKACHPTYAAEWAKTNHATLFARELDNKYNILFGQKTEYSESCAVCHTTGWYPGFPGTGGYFDAKAKANWTFPTWKEIDAGGNWDKAPADVKNMGNVGCEMCHGPASEHVKGAKVMQASVGNGVCNQCHGASAKHSRGWQIVFSGHSDPKTEAWKLEGPAEQQCMRCHSSEGYISFVAAVDPKTGRSNQAAWSNEPGTLGCAACHDPHNDTNPWQLRVGKLVDVPFETKQDVGLSATCMECHNTRRNLDDGAKAIEANGSPSYPHYSSAAELVLDLGGYAYKQTLPKGIHGVLGLGTKAIDAVPATPPDPLGAKFMFTRAEAKTGNIPGPCVVCHMWTTITDAKDPNYMKVGQHSFNMVAPDGKFQYTESCNQKGCHVGLKTFDKPAVGDYDGNGKTEGIQTEIKGLLNITWKALEAKNWKKVDGNPYATPPADADSKQKAAWYNFRTVYGVMWGAATGNGNEGKAAAIHNFKRSCALLQLSAKDLGVLPAGAADCTK